jgi:E3 Ubiquitin ligase
MVRPPVNAMLHVTAFLASDERFLIWPVIGAVAGIYWFYKGFRLLQRKRLILNTPASKIRSASMGLVEISGLATGPYLMTSPFKQAECYYYQSLAWELKQRGKNSDWVKVAEETLHVPFYIDDSTDKVLVDPRGAEMALHCDFNEQYHRSVLFEGPDMPGCVRDFLVRHGVDSGKRIKVEEYCIKPKNFLFVLGTLSQNPGIDASVAPSWAERADQPGLHQAPTEPQPEIIRLSNDPAPVPVTAMTQQQKIAAALTKAGITNPAAWNAAGGGGVAQSLVVAHAASAVKPATEAEESAEPLDMRGFDLHPPVVLMKGTNEPAFFISWRSQRDVVASLGWKSGLMIWGGPALTLGCTYILLAHFGVL